MDIYIYNLGLHWTSKTTNALFSQRNDFVQKKTKEFHERLKIRDMGYICTQSSF